MADDLATSLTPVEAITRKLASVGEQYPEHHAELALKALKEQGYSVVRFLPDGTADEQED